MAKREVAKFPLRSPRNWHGMTAGIWLPILFRNRFAISLTRLPMAASITFFSLINSGLGVLDQWRYGRAAAQARVSTPLFIIGHWRTGTTYLHELLVRDEQFAFPTTYQCMAPHHFLLTQRAVTSWLGWLLPERRPMDNMPIGWSKPQEDEFALCNLGAPSPYVGFAFPGRPAPLEPTLDLCELPESERQRWRDSMEHFLRRLALDDPRQLVLKSPTHTARLRWIRELFPDAQFVHTVRNPLVVVPSTIRTWQRMGDVLGLQTRYRDDLEEYLFRLYARMYARFEEDRRQLSPGQLYELKYEDLIADPLGEVQRLYTHFGISGFDAARPRIAAYLDSTRDYRPNRYREDSALEERIRTHWRDYIERYGYA